VPSFVLSIRTEQSQPSASSFEDRGAGLARIAVDMDDGSSFCSGSRGSAGIDRQRLASFIEQAWRRVTFFFFLCRCCRARNGSALIEGCFFFFVSRGAKGVWVVVCRGDRVGGCRVVPRIVANCQKRCRGGVLCVSRGAKGCRGSAAVWRNRVFVVAVVFFRRKRSFRHGSVVASEAFAIHSRFGCASKHSGGKDAAPGAFWSPVQRLPIVGGTNCLSKSSGGLMPGL